MWAKRLNLVLLLFTSCISTYVFIQLMSVGKSQDGYKLKQISSFDDQNNSAVKSKSNLKCEDKTKHIYPGNETAYEAMRKRKLVSMIWMPVDENGNFYVYSSYRDHISWRIRIIGVGNLKLRSKVAISVRCYIWETRASRIPKTVDGDFKFLPGGIENGYGCTITSCPIKKGQRPFAVSVTINNSHNVSNILEVNYPAKKKTNITVCIPVVHSNFDAVRQTISIIEMNKLVGTQRFVIYYYSASPKVNTMLDEYVNDGVFDIINWDLPIKNIHYYGQDVVNNDCLYRNMFISRYIVFTDLDEVIIPRKHTNLMSFMKSVETKDQNVGSFLFQNTFLCTDTQLKNDTKGIAQFEEAKKYNIVPLLHVWRDKTVFPWETRSKQIVISERVLAIRIHLIDPDMFRDKFKVHQVSPENGLLFHYRKCRGVKKLVKDDSIKKYSDQLLKNIKKKYSIKNQTV